MAIRNVVDPAGVAWNVRRRWYPWRRMMSMRELVNSARSDEKPEPEAETPGEMEDSSSNADSPRNIVLKVLYYAFAAIALIVYGRQARWPVEIGRQGEHFGTRHAADYAAAGELRDGLVAQIELGDVPSDQQASAA